MTTLTKPSQADIARLFIPLIPAAARLEGADTLPAYHDRNDRKATRHLGPRAAGLILKRSRRHPVPYMDDRGEPVFLVPLDDHGTRFAIVDAADWFALQEDGCDGLWNCADNGTGGLCAKTRRPVAGQKALNHVIVARFVLDLGPEAAMRYRSADRLDLRRCNLDSTAPTALPDRRPAKYRTSEAVKVSKQRRAAMAQGVCQ